jgi:hypothetical protein
MCSGRAAWDGCATRPYIRSADLDDAAKRLARLVFEHPGVIAEQAELHRDHDPTEADLAMVERTLAEIARKQESLALVASRIADPDAAAPLVERRAGWEASRRFLDDFADLAARVSRRLDSFEHADWQQAIDALGITATVRRAPSPDRFSLTTRLEGLMTSELLRSVAGDFEGIGLFKEGTVGS